MTLQLYFVRHGESEANLARVISNRDLPHALTAKGQAQAATLAQTLAPAGVRKIYASPILRARQTGEILGRALNAPVEMADGLREPDCGIAEGRGDADAWELQRQVMQAWLGEENLDARIEGGESFNEARARFVALIDHVLAAHRADDGGVVLIGHGGIFSLMLPLVLPGIDRVMALHYPIGNTAFALVEVTPAGLRCRNWFGLSV